MPKTKKRDVVLFINFVPDSALRSIERYNQRNNTHLKAVALVDTRLKKQQEALAKSKIGSQNIITCDTDCPLQVAETLFPYRPHLLAAVCRSETNQAYFQKIIPHIPYVRTPTVDSLAWSTDKVFMRQRFRLYDKKITPKFMVVKSADDTSIANIKKKVGFPLIMKPAALASSLLVTICFHEEELEKNLKKALGSIASVYKKNQRIEEPKVLVEEFMEGPMYSVDVYVSSRGKCYFCPPVYVKTGREVGFDDFFGYLQMTPTTLATPGIRALEEVAQKGIYALGLRSVTAHVELVRCEDGWKILEIGARVGGFRHELYLFSHGIDHAMNDILIRAAKVPDIPKKKKGHAAAMKFYAKKEGELKKLTGILKIQDLKSFVHIDINKALGDKCRFAKNGGKSVFNLYLFNKERSELLADIRRIEKSVDIATNGRGTRR